MINKLSKEQRKHLYETAKEFKNVISEKVSIYLLMGDVDGLGRLVSLINMLSGYEVIEALRKKGMDKEIIELCDKAGMKS
jgi:hypothetical protein